MLSSFPADYQRCRPALGTFVSIAVSGCGATVAQRGIERAFARIGAIQRAMSVHDQSSELNQLNRARAGAVLAISADTYAVLTLARRLYRASHGLFDPTVADTLMRYGLIPSSGRRVRETATFSDVSLLPGRRVAIHRPLALDLGGVAKGYAVDAAVQALRDEGISSGIVNAGGDLRVFGDRKRTIHVRHPAHETTVLPLLELMESAVATSATYFSRRRSGGTTVGALINPLTRRSVLHPWSVSVVAPTCAMADALTKVVFLSGDAATAVLGELSATAAIVDRHGRPRVLAAHAA